MRYIPFDSFFYVEVWKCGSSTNDTLIVKIIKNMKYESAFNAMDGILTSSPSLISYLFSINRWIYRLSVERLVCRWRMISH